MISDKYTSKEISWLAFNARVMQEASRKHIPLIERIKFLGIYSNNLDEFFRVRVATLKRLVKLDTPTVFETFNPAETLKEINKIVVDQSIEFLKIYEEIIKDLEKENIYILNENQLNAEQGQFVRNFFVKNVRPRLMPLILDDNRKLPDLKDDAIYLAVQFTTKHKKEETYALIEIPSEHIGRFIILPKEGNKKSIILLDDVIRYELNDVFYMFDILSISAYVIKLTRDAELDINDDISSDYIKQISKGLEKRKDANPVRFICDKDLPEPFLKLLLKKLKFSKLDNVNKGGRYHNFKDFMGFPNIGRSSLYYKPNPAIPHPQLHYGMSMFSVLKEKDILFHFPYHSFHHIIDYLREASIDPYVTEIKITIYRLAKYSNVINALINAVRNGKKVTAVLELQARFDEKANIKWSARLHAEGVKVILGVPGLKVHSKLLQISRLENKKTVTYVGIGTGNFNEITTKVFSDKILLTSHKGIAKDVSSIFDFFEQSVVDKSFKSLKTKSFNHLLVAPLHLRKNLIQLIQTEIANAKAGKKAYIYLKLNNLVDFEIVQQLYEAHLKGVDVRLNIRGMVSLVPNFDKSIKPIPCISIIDRYLEHSRIYFFCADGEEKLFISSADLMSRNLDRRIEVACPILDNELKNEIKKLWDFQWKDNMSARIIDEKLTNKLKSGGTSKPIRSQEEFYKYLKSQHQTKKSNP